MLAAVPGAPKLRRIYLGLAAALTLPACLAFAPAALATPTPLTCGDTITANTNLSLADINSLNSCAADLGSGEAALIVENNNPSTPIVINLAGRTLYGPDNGDGIGIKNLANNVLIENGTVSGFYEDVLNCATQDATYARMNLKDAFGPAFADRNSLFTTVENSVISESTATAPLSIAPKSTVKHMTSAPTSKTATAPEIPEYSIGVLTEGTGGDVFMNNQVSGFYYAFDSEADVNSQYLHNQVSNSYIAFENGYCDYVKELYANVSNSANESFANNMVTVPNAVYLVSDPFSILKSTSTKSSGIAIVVLPEGNWSNDTQGFVDPDGNLAAGQWLNNTTTGGEYGFDLYDNPVYLRGNHADGAEYGIETGISDIPIIIGPKNKSPVEFGPTSSQVLSNEASNDFLGIADFASEGSYWTGNTLSNDGAGMFIVDPYADSITGNSFQHSYVGMFLLGENEGNAWTVSNNSARSNIAGMAATFPEPGGENTAQNDSWFDCYLVSCTGNGTTHGPASDPIGPIETDLGVAPLQGPALHAQLADQPVAPVLPTS